MDGGLQRHIVHDSAVHTHANHRLILKGLNVDIAGAGVVAADDQALHQLDHRSVAISLLHIQLLNNLLLCCAVGCPGSHPGADFGIVIIDSPQQRRLFRQTDVQIHAHHLPHLFDSVQVHRVAGDDLQAVVRDGKGDNRIVYSHLPWNPLHGGNVEIAGANVDQRQGQPLAQGLQHLPLGDEPQLDEDFTHAQALVAVFSLVGQGLLNLGVGDVAVFLQHLPNGDVFHVITLPPVGNPPQPSCNNPNSGSWCYLPLPPQRNTP